MQLVNPGNSRFYVQIADQHWGLQKSANLVRFVANISTRHRDNQCTRSSGTPDGHPLSRMSFKYRIAVQSHPNEQCIYKSPCSEAITPADHQNNIDPATPRRLSIYRDCVSCSYITEQLIKCNVILIPKGGKASNTKAKDFWQIS